MQVSETNRQLVKFLVAAVLFFAWVTIQGATQAQKPVADFLQFGPARIIVGAHSHTGTLGWVSLSLMAAIYYLVPVLSGKPIAWRGLINWLFWLWVIFLAVTLVLMNIVGIQAGSAFAAGVKGPALGAIMGPYLMILGWTTIIQALLALLFVIQILVSLGRAGTASK